MQCFLLSWCVSGRNYVPSTVEESGKEEDYWSQDGMTMVYIVIGNDGGICLRAGKQHDVELGNLCLAKC